MAKGEADQAKRASKWNTAMSDKTTEIADTKLQEVKVERESSGVLQGATLLPLYMWLLSLTC